jgi:hypothetical protein
MAQKKPTPHLTTVCQDSEGPCAYLFSVSAASFIYIALADLVPGRRASGGLRSLARELPLIAPGIATIFALRVKAAH